MVEHVNHSAICDQEPLSSIRSEKRRGATRPSPHDIHGVFQWIDEAAKAQRIWARNTLIVVVVLAGLVILGLRLGVLSP